MSDTPNKSREEQVAELRRQWLAYAGAAFDLMFHPEHQPDLTSFDQREARACESVDDLKAWLLQQHLDADPDACPPVPAQPQQTHPVNCPRCGKPARRVERPDKPPLLRRSLASLAGEVTLKRAEWRCATCRVAFFPSGPQTRAGG
jgi:hypothetical protein